MSEALRERRNLRNLLSRSWPSDDAEDLADHLLGCKEAAPCFSGACPRCNLGAQRMMVAAGHHAVERSRSDLAMVTVINTHGRVPFGELRRHELYVDFRRRLVEVLDRLGIPAVGGFELSLNTSEEGRYDPFYAEQCHFFCSMVRAKRLHKALKRAFESNDAILRPVRIEKFDCRKSGVAYAHKNRAQWRMGLARSLGHRYSTRWKPLPSAARVEVALAQHRAGLDANVLAVGFRLVPRDRRMLLVQWR